VGSNVKQVSENGIGEKAEKQKTRRREESEEEGGKKEGRHGGGSGWEGKKGRKGRKDLQLTLHPRIDTPSKVTIREGGKGNRIWKRDCRGTGSRIGIQRLDSEGVLQRIEHYDPKRIEYEKKSQKMNHEEECILGVTVMEKGPTVGRGGGNC
jgi:hypothetical protein